MSDAELDDLQRRLREGLLISMADQRKAADAIAALRRERDEAIALFQECAGSKAALRASYNLALAESAQMAAALVDGVAECTAAIAYEAGGKDDPDAIPNGLRTTAHIKLSMIRTKLREALGSK